MSTPLYDWQARLERHFQSLACARADSGFPVFALEHGLASEEAEELAAQLRSTLRTGSPLASHWLLWVIYSAERGYAYAGDEYWRSFEEQMPEWQFSDRYKIASWFQKFQQSYDGVVPTGSWANHFRIIAWPITHAILPRYLQRQFARLLYELRFRLAGLASLEPAVIGRLLAANATHASTRFEDFLEQEELAGRIVLALLGDTRSASIGPVYENTLERIVTDLRDVRNAREWLDEARRVATDRFRGIGHGTGPPSQGLRTTGSSPPPHSARELSIQPRLLLRYSGGGTWALLLEIPPFRNLAALNADIRSFLGRTRCRFNGSDEARPAGWLLRALGRLILKSWPDPNVPLVRFEKSHPLINQLLESECRMSPGPRWLFKVGSDGLARQVLSCVVRPGEDYILLTTAELAAPQAWVRPCSLTFGGVQAYRIRTPENVTADEIKWLRDQELPLVRTIRVWPSGLPGRGWDGEGASEWLTTEPPCLGIVHDHPVGAYAIRLDDGPETFIDAPPAGQPTFIQLTPLPAGRHKIHVRAHRDASLRDVARSSTRDGYLQLHVREPEPWSPGVLSHPGIIVSLEPQDAGLDALWNNEVSLSVVGPSGRSVAVSLTLEDRNGDSIGSMQVCHALKLPIAPDDWRNQFSRFLQGEDDNWAYLSASAGRLTLRADELGECQLRFRHEALPLRWTSYREGERVVVRLIDDTGVEYPPEVSFLSMDHPVRCEKIAPESARAGILVEPPGGLFRARHGEHRDLAIVSAGLTGQGFQGLSVNPAFAELAAGSIPLADTLRLFAEWTTARLAGVLAHTRQQQVCDSFLASFYGAICGPTWARAEAAFRRSQGHERELDVLKRLVGHRPAFAVVLLRDYEKMRGEIRAGVIWFADLARRYKVCANAQVAEFALRLASQPDKLALKSLDALAAPLDALAEKPDVMRGARLLALLCARDERPAAVSVLPRWSW